MRCQTAVAATLLASLLAACAGGRTSGSGRPDPTVADLLAGVLPADALLLGEQHDAPDHPRWQHAAVAALAAQGRLAALALEMAPAGTSTAGLAPDADDPAGASRAALGRAGLALVALRPRGHDRGPRRCPGSGRQPAAGGQPERYAEHSAG
jgi:hypothetical protein